MNMDNIISEMADRMFSQNDKAILEHQIARAGDPFGTITEMIVDIDKGTISLEAIKPSDFLIDEDS